MKKCPVCEAIAFDDQTTCYGCLHSYEDEGSALADVTFDDALPDATASEGGTPADVPPGDATLRDGPVSFVIRFEPSVDAQGALELRCTIA